MPVSGQTTYPVPPAGGGGISAITGPLGQYGNGSGGDFTVTGTTTLTAEMYYDNLTVNAGGTLKPAGYRIFVKSALTIAATGSINDDGNSASGTTQGAALVARAFLGGAAGAGSAGRTIQGIGGGGSGTASSSYNDSGVAPSGGRGGDGSATYTGGNAGVATILSPNPQRANGCWQAGRPYGSTSFWTGGAGGGAGGLKVTAPDTPTSGGGGSGGGAVWIAAKTVSNSGTISANGGNGGDAAGGTANSAGGGGGGGGGGLVWLITDTTASSVGTVTANAGNGGAGSGTGAAAGNNGNAGSVILVSYGGA